LATKKIAISEEAYQRLKALKKPGESFTEVIERMTSSKGVLDLTGILSPSQAKEVSERIRESRTESSRHLQRTVEKLSRRPHLDEPTNRTKLSAGTRSVLQ
jgi:predicted CopG family antitoxin